MARYIDADELIEFITKGLNNPDKTKAFGYDAIEILTEIKYTPTADVVPRAEVEKIIGKFECLLCHATGGRLSKHTYDLRTMETVVTDCINETYNDGYGEGYKDCAREIFEEIEAEITEAIKCNYKCRTEYYTKERFKKEDGEFINTVKFINTVNGKIDALQGMDDFIAELKKKYLEEKE